VLNSLKDAGAAFGHDTNKITIIDRPGKVYVFPLKNKSAVAHDIKEAILAQLNFSVRKEPLYMSTAQV
jgi:phosphopantothenoylcysteine decarboxylase / phosphopantothenate---cysteine ligase